MRLATAACMQKFGNVSFVAMACAKCMRYGGGGGGGPYHWGGGGWDPGSGLIYIYIYIYQVNCDNRLVWITGSLQDLILHPKRRRRLNRRGPGLKWRAISCAAVLQTPNPWALRWKHPRHLSGRCKARTEPCHIMPPNLVAIGTSCATCEVKELLHKWILLMWARQHWRLTQGWLRFFANNPSWILSCQLVKRCRLFYRMVQTTMSTVVYVLVSANVYNCVASGRLYINYRQLFSHVYARKLMATMCSREECIWGFWIWHW